MKAGPRHLQRQESVMKLSGFHTKFVAIALTAAMALGTVVPAFAGNGNGRGHGNGKKYRRGEYAQSWGGSARWGGRERGTRGYRGYRAPARAYYGGAQYHSHSNAGPVIAGIIG